MPTTVTSSASGPRFLAAEELRARVIAELVASGFEESGGLIVPPPGDIKIVARLLHERQRDLLLLRHADFIDKWEQKLLPYFADGTEIDAASMKPEVIPVDDEEQAALFRFAGLHWSVPVSQGYGRRTRFLLLDRSIGKLIGVFALGDPVFNLRVRDTIIGWDSSQRSARLYNVFDAFVLGAVEPYRQLIAGKLVAMAAVAEPTIEFLARKYDGKTTHIAGEKKPSRPVLVTTTSALGRSSIYNRLRYGERLLYAPVGFTQGWGHFQFSESLFSDLVDFSTEHKPMRGNRYGDGPNWKMRTLRVSLELLGMDPELLRHGIQREVYVAPLAVSWRAFLRGETDKVKPFAFDLDDMADFFRSRWAVPRAERRPEFQEHRADAMRLSPAVERLLQRVHPDLGLLPASE